MAVATMLQGEEPQRKKEGSGEVVMFVPMAVEILSMFDLYK